MALVALGDVLRSIGALSLAARAYGSIIDLYPSRADMRRFAGGFLEAVGRHHLAGDSYGRALRQRPDHPSGYRLMALSLLRQGRHRRAFATLAAGLRRRYPEDRFAGVKRILREDLALVAGAWIARQPGERAAIMARLARFKITPATRPSLRLVLTWESDASDMDLHLVDRLGEPISAEKWGRKREAGRTDYDVTSGYGPERLTLRGGRTPSHRIRVTAYNRGATGHGLGKVQIVRHDGKGGVRLEDRPFVVMKTGATLDLGPLQRSETWKHSR